MLGSPPTCWILNVYIRDIVRADFGFYLLKRTPLPGRLKSKKDRSDIRSAKRKESAKHERENARTHPLTLTPRQREKGLERLGTPAPAREQARHRQPAVRAKTTPTSKKTKSRTPEHQRLVAEKMRRNEANRMENLGAKQRTVWNKKNQEKNKYLEDLAAKRKTRGRRLDNEESDASTSTEKTSERGLGPTKNTNLDK